MCVTFARLWECPLRNRTLNQLGSYFGRLRPATRELRAADQQSF